MQALALKKNYEKSKVESQAKMKQAIEDGRVDGRTII